MLRDRWADEAKEDKAKIARLEEENKRLREAHLKASGCDKVEPEFRCRICKEFPHD